MISSRRRPQLVALFAATVVGAAASPRPAVAQEPDRETVERAIQRGIGALLARIPSPDESRRGFIEDEMRDIHRGGPSALAAFALLVAGVETTHPKLAHLIDSLARDESPDAGTYVHSLRAVVWSTLLDRRISKSHRRMYRKLLHAEMRWLMRAMNPSGAYGYAQVGRRRPDNSNTQFANLGLWAGSVAEAEVASRYWKQMAEYWLENQHPAGGWGYLDDRGIPTPSMTVAGCNSLYIALDRFYARADGPYVFFKGAAPDREAREKMQLIYRAINGGDNFLRFHRPNIGAFYGYELFGLERLGLAGGQAQIGGVDWFRRYVETVVRWSWGEQAIADAFGLIFLVHGRAPVLIQKLEHGHSAEDWNYYHRDLHSLMRYMSRTFERLYRWQRIPVDASLSNMQDAPMLYIGGHEELDLPDATLQRIRSYIDEGGTVFLHADLASNSFVRSATRVFEKMFSDRRLQFTELDESHPLYRCHFGAQGWKKRVPLQALADGPRALALLSPVDIAGAWHQDRRRHEKLFQIMANVRVYCAPPYGKLPTVLRSWVKPVRTRRPIGELSINRLHHDGDWDAHLGVWRRRRDDLANRTGLRLNLPRDDSDPDLERLHRFDIVHLTTRGTSQLDAQTQKGLESYLTQGGFLLIDAADGQPPGSAAVRRLVDQLRVGEKGVLSADHPIASGAMPGGRSLFELKTTQAGASLNRSNSPPPILTRTIGRRLAVVACPFDLVAGLDRSFVWNRLGYQPQGTSDIAGNILLWRFHQLQGRFTKSDEDRIKP